MKKQTLISAAILFVAFTIAGCEKIKSWTEVSFDAEYSGDIDVSIDEQERNTTYSFNKSVTIDPNSNSDFKKHKNKIDKIDVKSVRAEVSSLSVNSVTLTNLELEVSGNARNTTWNYPQITVSNGDSFNLPQDETKLRIIEKILEDKESFTVTAEGETDQNPVDFIITFTTRTHITANAL